MDRGEDQKAGKTMRAETTGQERRGEERPLEEEEKKKSMTPIRGGGGGGGEEGSVTSISTVFRLPSFMRATERRPAA